VNNLTRYLIDLVSLDDVSREKQIFLRSAATEQSIGKHFIVFNQTNILVSKYQTSYQLYVQ